jgi:hypothetical protein
MLVGEHGGDPMLRTHPTGATLFDVHILRSM